MRRLATCALSLAVFLSLGKVSLAATTGSAPFSLASSAIAERANQYQATVSPASESLFSGATVDSFAASEKPGRQFSETMMWGVAAPQEHVRVSTVTHHAHGLSGLTAGIINRTRQLAARITSSAMHFLGTPYSFGGTTAAGFDCSGYVQHVFRTAGISLPRTADAQYAVGHHVDTAHAQRGDLVFFQTYTAGVSHVGIYLGNDRFIHSSSSRGVTVSSLHEPYWSARYIGAERILNRSMVDHVLAKT